MESVVRLMLIMNSTEENECLLLGIPDLKEPGYVEY